MKDLKKGMLVFTFLFTIATLVFTSNIKVHAGSVKTTELDLPTDETTNEDNIELPEEDFSEGSEEEPEDGIKNTDTSTGKVSHKYDKYFQKASMTKSVTRAAGLEWRLSLTNITLDSKHYEITWISSNEKIATVSSKGKVTTKKAGKAVISAIVKCDNNSTYTYKTQFTVTDPHFQSKYYGMQVGDKIKLKVKGTTTSNYTVKIKNTKVAKRVSKSSNRIKADRLGSTQAYVTIDGRKITCMVYVTNPKLFATDLFVEKGGSQKIKIKKWSGKTTPAYKSSNTKIATVTKAGYVEGHKNGSCKVTVTVDGKKLSCYVAVSNKTVVKTLKSAYSKIGCRYSQARRMSKNYYDCSSFAWRNYSKYGVTFGNKKYAPTASEEARYMVKRHKAVAYKYVNKDKLVPGDVIFVKSSSNNGRYRNVGHVCIYMGNGRIIHATPPRVCISKYSRYTGRIAVIARPTK